MNNRTRIAQAIEEAKWAKERMKTIPVLPDNENAERAISRALDGIDNVIKDLQYAFHRVTPIDENCNCPKCKTGGRK